jgi:DNA-binding transcriptional ArsR family regulator
MLVKTLSTPFGSKARTRTLVALHLLGTSFARELSRLLDMRVWAITGALVRLQRDGLVSGRLMGRSRMYTLNPGYFARRELDAYLSRLAEGDVDLRERVAQLRRRPRRVGKPL